MSTKTVHERLESAASEVRWAARQMPGASTDDLRRRRSLHSVTTALVTAGLVLGSFGVLGRVVLERSSREPGGVGAASTQEPSDPGQLSLSPDPSLELVLVGAEQHGPSPRPQSGDRYFQVFRSSAHKLTPPIVWILTEGDGSDMVEDGEPQVFIDDQVTAFGATARRAFLGWEGSGGEAVFLGALGLRVQDAIDLAAGLHREEGEPGWSLGEDPFGLSLVQQIAAPPLSTSQGFLRTAQTWSGAKGEVQLITASPGDAAFEEWLFEVFDDAKVIETTTVRGATALVVESDLGVSVAWQETEGTAVMLELYGRTAEDRDAILGALTEIDEASWRAILEEERDEGPSDTTPPSTHRGEG